MTNNVLNDEVKKERANFSIDKKLMQRLRIASKMSGIPMSTILEDCLRKYMGLEPILRSNPTQRVLFNTRKNIDSLMDPVISSDSVRRIAEDVFDKKMADWERKNMIQMP